MAINPGGLQSTVMEKQFVLVAFAEAIFLEAFFRKRGGFVFKFARVDYFICNADVEGSSAIPKRDLLLGAHRR